MIRSRFVVVKHDAIRARLHYDLRFVMPKSKIWASFAVRKGVPLKPGTKVLAVRTHDHSEKEALMFGTISKGYGAGRLTKWDDGQCIIHKYTPGHISIEFKGKKVKGLYHMVSTGVINKKEFKKRSYMLFKSSSIREQALYEVMGMIGMVPRGGIVDDVESSTDELISKPMSWGSTETVTGPKSELTKVLKPSKFNVGLDLKTYLKTLNK